jgi:hypothetical protein
MSKSAAEEKRILHKSIDGTQLASSTEFSERIARHRPEDNQINLFADWKNQDCFCNFKKKAPLKTISSNESLGQIYDNCVSFAPLTDQSRNNISILIV